MVFSYDWGGQPMPNWRDLFVLPATKSRSIGVTTVNFRLTDCLPLCCLPSEKVITVMCSDVECVAPGVNVPRLRGKTQI